MKKTILFILTLFTALSVEAQNFNNNSGELFGNFTPIKKWKFSLGTGISFTGFKAPAMDCNCHNIKALTNYYSAAASYSATKKLSLYSAITYYRTTCYGSEKKGGMSFDRDAYITSFGANYQITPSFSLGFEIRHAENASPYGFYYGY